VTDRSSDPFHLTLKRLLADADLTPYALSRKCRELGWGSSSGINETARGNFIPGADGIEVIAKALGVEPEVFAEYRLLKRRAELDFRAVGLKKALRNLGE
jgi:transcriptional regulator with XRE-family HTH domain